MTLIELLVAMMVFLIISGAAMTFLIVSIDQQNSIVSRTDAARQAEGGLQQLDRDLRQAMALDASNNALTVQIWTDSTTKTTSASFYVPTPGNDTTGQLVTWSCPSTAATSVGSCTRSLGSTSLIKIAGVKSLAFTALDSSGNAITLCAAQSGCALSPASVSMTAQIYAISQLDHTSGRTNVVRGASNPITVQSGTDLRNFA